MTMSHARDLIQSLPASRIREVANAAIGRDDVLAFWFGESDQATPSFIRDAAVASISAGQTFYAPNLGRQDLRETVAAYLGNLHGRPFSLERIAVSSSGVSAIMLAAQLVVGPGDRVVAVTPLWPNIVEIPRILGAEVVRVPLRVRDGRWMLDVDELLAALTPGTRALLLNSPNNPTGWMIDADAQRALFDHCRRHGIWVICDDVYERLVYQEGLRSAPSFLALAGAEERVIGINSFSKAWCMTGWRIGWLVVPPAILPDLAKLIEYNTSCAPDFVQLAAAAAMRDGEQFVAALRGKLQTERSRLQAALRALPGVELPEAAGAMYAFFRIAGHADSLGLAKTLIDEVGLGLAPGCAFGPEGEGWLRWCYAASEEKMRDGIGRLQRFLRG
ncbi:MAG TPA: pyridoxal phosphate-dependent aminotransferase [Burkholderiaceae bacterium]|jgi:aspartate/methionine/tyrosine aminotransferase